MMVNLAGMVMAMHAEVEGRRQEAEEDAEVKREEAAASGGVLTSVGRRALLSVSRPGAQLDYGDAKSVEPARMKESG